MSRRLLLGLGGAGAGAAAALLLALVLFQPVANTAIAAMEILPVLKVYRNGELVYEKIGDPPLENWAKVIAAILTDQGQTIIDMSATSGTLKHGDSGDSLVGRIGSGDTSACPVVVAGYIDIGVAYSTYTFTKYTTAPVSMINTGWNTDHTEYIIKVKGTVSFNENMTVNAVGLAIRPVIDYDQRTVLVFADELPQPINVTNTDGLTIVYEIHIKWPTTGS